MPTITMIDWNSDGEIIADPIILNRKKTPKKEVVNTASYKTDVEWVLCSVCDKQYGKTNIYAHNKSDVHLNKVRMLTLKQMKQK